MDYRELVNLGLSEKEAKVYIASLEIGKDVVQNISKKAKVNRATTYVVIESLTKKGLLSSFQKEKKQFFYAESPEKLSILFREEAMAIQRKHEYLEKIMPSLKALKSNSNDEPVVRYFEGKDGLRAMSDEFLMENHKETAKMIFSYDLLNNVFTDEERKKITENRIKKKIKIKAIINDENKSLISDAKRHIISTKKYPITSDIAFFGNKVRIATQKGDIVGLIIENKEISNTLKTLFDLAWKYLNKKGV